MPDIRQTSEHAKYLRSQGWIVERLGGTNYFLRKLPILGFILKLQRPNKIVFKNLEKLQNKYRIFQTIVEPVDEKQTEELQSRGYHLSKSPYLPTKTLQINLRESKKNIFANFDKDTRYCLRKVNNFTVFTDTELQSFHEAWQKCVGWKRYVSSKQSLASLKQYYGNNVIFASHNDIGTKNKSMRIPASLPNHIIAGAIFIKSGDTTYYWQAFTSKRGRTSLSQYVLVWQGILWGRKIGADEFDFEGVYDNRFPNKSWRGFTKFKEGFGGTLVQYPGTYIRTRLFGRAK